MPSNICPSAVPTNIITGFLGAGKTSAIMHLLKNKPRSERWAVLVNEFGEIGIDGSLLKAKCLDNPSVFIREVSGGCMCCRTSFAMQIALAELLAKHKPDRVLIEPTGLGHPFEIAKLLSAAHYQQTIALHKIITLVDARNFTQQQYLNHDTFNQQIALADVIVANKLDLYSSADKAQLHAYLAKKRPDNPPLVLTEQGVTEGSVLIGSSDVYFNSPPSRHQPAIMPTPAIAERQLPSCGYLKASNQSDGFKSIGWRLAPRLLFDYSKLREFLSGVEAQRAKGIVITNNGVFAFNYAQGTLNEFAVDDCLESRIEIITEEGCEQWHEQLMGCLIGFR